MTAEVVSKLEALDKQANSALFELHRYMEDNNIGNWREIYSARCRVGENVYWLLEKLRKEVTHAD
jgi:hypothetical protein